MSEGYTMSVFAIALGRVVVRAVVLGLVVVGLLAAVPVGAQAYNRLEPCGEIRNAGAPGFWRVEPPMPTQYDEPRAVRVGSYVYLAGGIADIDPRTYRATSVDQFLRYDLVTQQYRQLAPLPMRLSHVGVTSYGGDIYVVGGLTDDLVTPGATARAFHYITAQDRWVEIAGLPSPRGAFGLVTVGHFMYAIGGVPQGPQGGRQQTAARTAANDAYDFNTGTWSSRRPIPTARDHLGVTAYNGLIYAVGGRTANNYARSEFERYDPATDTWASLAPIPVGSSGVQMVAVNGRLVVASGGDDIVNWVDGRVFSYDPAASSWSQLPAIPKPVHGYAAADYNGRLEVFGGSECASFAPVTDTESLDVPGDPVPVGPGLPGNINGNAAPAATSTTSSAPPEKVLSLRSVGFLASQRTITARRSGYFSYSLTGTPVGASGRISFGMARAIAAARKRKLSLGSGYFTISSTGRATVSLQLSRRNRTILKHKRRLSVRATVTVGSATRSVTFVLKAPR